MPATSPQALERKREYKRKYQREWYKNNREKALEYGSYRNLSVETLLCKRAQTRAAKAKIDFELKKNDVIVPALCPVFEVPMERGTPYAPSLDRIDPTKGYLKDNIQVISRKANTMKSNASAEELRKFANWIINQNK